MSISPGQRRVLDCMIDQGVDGICVLANYSEQFLLSDEERTALLDLCLGHVAGRVPVIVTCSHFSTQIAADRARRAANAGAKMLMLMPPYHGTGLRATTAAISSTSQRVAEAAGVPDHGAGRAAQRRHAVASRSWHGWRARCRWCATSRSRCRARPPSCGH